MAARTGTMFDLFGYPEKIWILEERMIPGSRPRLVLTEGGLPTVGFYNLLTDTLFHRFFAAFAVGRKIRKLRFRFGRAGEEKPHDEKHANLVRGVYGLNWSIRGEIAPEACDFAQEGEVG